MPTGVFISRLNGKVCITGNSDRMADAMFQEYDTKCEEHVRVSFRLPSLFIGRMQDMNYASSVSAYMVAEAQVFGPERFLFDEVINRKVCTSLGAANYEFVSLPASVKDMQQQLAAM